jgi:putative DNA primase/helicase
MIEAVAKATETPVELGATLGLTTIATCCQKIFEVVIDASYREPLSLWGVSALESGNRKTAVHFKMTEPLRVKERELCEQSKAAIAQAESERATTEARVKAIRARIANCEDFEDIAQGQREIDRLLVAMPDVPAAPRLWAQDITPEQLGRVMADNGERMAILSDEGGLFDILAGRYSNGVPNLDLFLQSHAGAPVRVDRGSRPSLVMHRPTLTIGLSPQPSVLRGLTGKPGFRERGLLARFIYTLPPSQLGYRHLRTEPVPIHVSTAYHEMVMALLAFEPERNDYGDVVPFQIRMSSEAEGEWREFAVLVEVNMRPGGVYEHLKDWAGKLPGAALRAAGLFHCVQYAHE